MTWTDREGPIHRAVLAYLRSRLPNAAIHHSPNELALRGKHVARQIAKAKHNGMVPGWPDIEVVHEGRFMAFEVKAEGNYQSDTQKDCEALIRASGGLYAVVRSTEDVKECLDDWMPWIEPIAEMEEQ